MSARAGNELFFPVNRANLKIEKGEEKFPLVPRSCEWGTRLRQRLPAGLSKDSGFLRFRGK